MDDGLENPMIYRGEIPCRYPDCTSNEVTRYTQKSIARKHYQKENGMQYRQLSPDPWNFRWAAMDCNMCAAWPGASWHCTCSSEMASLSEYKAKSRFLSFIVFLAFSRLDFDDANSF